VLLVECEVELQDVDRRLTHEAKGLVYLSISSFTAATSVPRAFATRAACSRAYPTLICGSSPEPLAVTASAGTAGWSGASPRIEVTTALE
jgi:hypothetical protein